ncbi:MAG: hypothetical protein ACOC05_07290, partial [Oceanicaulis sp.]
MNREESNVPRDPALHQEVERIQDMPSHLQQRERSRVGLAIVDRCRELGLRPTNANLTALSGAPRRWFVQPGEIRRYLADIRLELADDPDLGDIRLLSPSERARVTKDKVIKALDAIAADPDQPKPTRELLLERSGITGVTFRANAVIRALLDTAIADWLKRHAHTVMAQSVESEAPYVYAGDRAITAFEDLLAEGADPAALTLQQIAERAGVSKATVSRTTELRRLLAAHRSPASSGATLQDRPVPPHLQRVVMAFGLDRALASGILLLDTALDYARGLVHWQSWCAGRGIAPLPVTPQTFAQFLADAHAAATATSQIETIRSALSVAHDALHLPPPFGARRRRRSGLSRAVREALVPFGDEAWRLVADANYFPQSLQGHRRRILDLGRLDAVAHGAQLADLRRGPDHHSVALLAAPSSGGAEGSDPFAMTVDQVAQTL